jgi:uncharacterized membrane protein YtjA (UPF0391 family)
MLRMALGFLLVAIIAAVCGFGRIAGAATDIAQILFFIFIVLFVLSFLGHLLSGPGRAPSP